MRRFSTASALSMRARGPRAAVTGGSANVNPLVMRPPIEPRVSDVQTPADHPLWQFFSKDRAYIRRAGDLEDIGSAWTIPQLRRKGFDDLHTLWYVCLRELNRLNREMRLLAQYENRPSQDTRRYDDDENKFAEVAAQVRTTMWRIRHVLSERYHGYMRMKQQDKEHLYSTQNEENTPHPDIVAFEEQYLTADSNADAQVNAQLERYVGLNPRLVGHFPEPRVVRGLYTAARLKLQRYASEQQEVTDVRDIREAYTLFTAEGSPEGVADAVSTIKEIRSQAEPVPRAEEMAVLAEIMHAAQSEDPVHT